MDILQIRTWANELGFAKLGVCSTKEFALQRRQVTSEADIRERKQLRYAPEEDYPWAKALLVLLYPYSPSDLPSRDGQVFVDSYYEASNRAYHAAAELKERILAAGCKAEANVPYPAKTAAIRAGLGVIGDHTMLITPEFGTRVVIMLLATDAVEPADEPNAEAGACLHCGRCETACPTGAIDSVHGYHPERCLRNFMMEGMVVPEIYRDKMDNRLIGCDCCQRACPMQPDMRGAHGQPFAIRDFLAEDEAVFRNAVKQLAGCVGKNMIRPQRVRAQAALLAGSMKHRAAIPVLKTWAESEFEAVRIHAQWALKHLSEADSGT